MSADCFRPFILLGIGLWICASPSLANQSQDKDPVARLGSLYEALQFQEVVRKGKELLKHPERFTPDQLARIHEYLGLAYYSLGRLDSARSHFVSELELDPDRRLDPIRVSPKIIDFFNRLREQRQLEGGKTSFVPYVRYVFIEDPRPAAAWRSALLPGWGQWYKRQRTRAGILGGAFWTSVLATGTAFYLERQARTHYINQKNPPEIQQAYDRYNFWYRSRQLGLRLVLFTWVAAVTDALWTPASNVKVQPTVGEEQTLGLHLRVQW